MTKVKMISPAVTPFHGMLKTGDVVECDEDYARKLVVDFKVAEYLTVHDVPKPVQPNDKKAGKK
jgi:hypothetical protein